MTEILFAVALLVLDSVLVLMMIIIERLYKEICEIKVKLEHHQVNLDYLESCDSANEHRIDELEDMLELKEWLDKEKGGKNENN